MIGTRPHTPSARRRLAAGLVCGGLLSVGLAGAASAKGGVDPVVAPGATACNPVSALSYKGDATTAETGLATILVTYAVKPCTSAPVVVATTLSETVDPTAIAYSDPAAPLSGKFLVSGVRPAFSYQATVSVFDAATGSLVGSKTIFAAANYKRV